MVRVGPVGGIHVQLVAGEGGARVAQVAAFVARGSRRREWQLARWIDGRSVVRSGRRKQVGLGEGSSGLASN